MNRPSVDEFRDGRKRDFNALVIVHSVSAIPPTQVQLLFSPITDHCLLIALIVNPFVAEPPEAYRGLKNQWCIRNQELDATWELGKDLGGE